MKFLTFIIIYTFLQSQELEITPRLTYGYESDSEEYHQEGVESHDFEVGVLGRYSRGGLNIQTYLAYHFLQGPVYNQSQFTPVQGLHWVSKDPGLGENQKNYYVSDMQVQYGDTSSYIYINKWDKHWGPGVRSLTVSNKIPTFPHLGFRWQVTDQIQLEYFHGQLRSGIVDSSYLNYFASGKSPQIMRNIAGHRLDWQPNEKWNISISELVIYANRSLEMAYLLPFIPFFPLQNYLNDTDNIVMSADVQYFYQNNIRIYGAFLMDEWSPPYTFDKDNHNWFGWQTGFEWEDVFILASRLRMEYTWTDHRIYRHRFPVNDFYSWGYPVGFWGGPHAQELYADYSFSLGDNHFEIMVSDAKRGELTDPMLKDQYNRPNDDPIYERFSEGIEEKQVIVLSLNRDITKKLNVNLSYTYVDWKNAGFNPSDPQDYADLPDITKHSMGIAIQYQY